ncbi:MAG: hypothetical protein GW855_06275 [Erythrobacter sp.]|nr:hypothetical protein [Erythrobacter sp.]NCQ64560.1 hypothetical protein [Alphaproteobacteria bacterium]
MLGPDPDQQRRMAGEMDRSIEQIEREASSFINRLVLRWAVRWAIVFAVIFAATRLVDWLDWLWWIALPIAVLSLGLPLLLRRFLMKRLTKVRGSFGGFAFGETIDGSWRDGSGGAYDDRPARGEGGEPRGVIIDQRPQDKDDRL